MTDPSLYDPSLTKAEADPRFGAIPGIAVGSTFKSR